jgi:arylsulfatase A-like enzyme
VLYTAMRRRKFVKTATSLTIAAPLFSMTGGCASNDARKPNVLFIAVDDLNDWVGCMGGHPAAQTPNIDRLARQGCLFSQAYTPVPYCKPARGNVMTGLYAHSSGVYRNEYFRDQVPEAKTIPELFMANGYFAAGCGKVFHLSQGRTEEQSSWHEFSPFYRPSSQLRQNPSLSGIADLANKDTLDWGVIDDSQEEFADWKIADWAIAQLARRHDRPLFLGVGFRYPHLPWYVPAEYLERFSDTETSLPQILEDDLTDVPPFGRELAYGSRFRQP